MAKPNWRVVKYNERKSALVKQSEEILDRCLKDGDREPTAEEQASLTANQTDLKALAGKIDRETELSRYVSEPHEAGNSGFDGQVPGQPEKPAAGNRVGNSREAFEQDPKRGFKSPREFVLCVLKHGDREVQAATDPRLRFLAAAGSDEQGSYSDPYGGFLVPQGFHPDLLALSAEVDPIGSRTTKVPMETPHIKIPARTDKDHSTGSVSGGLLVTRRAETLSQAATRMQMEQVALVATSLFGLAYVTEELMTDSPISFAALLEKGFRDQFTSHLINERLFGTGVGEFEGVMNSPALITVDQEPTQDAGTIVYDNIINMRSRCWNYSKAVWQYNQDCLPQLMKMYFTAVSGATTVSFPIWQTSAREGEPDMLLGRPAYPSEYCQTVGTVGDLVLAVWDEYLEGTYEPLQSAESIHVRFVNHERTFKFWTRNAGRCWWRSPLTPRRSAKTLSPFVALETRVTST